MKLSTILDHIDNGHMALPEFQRGYVWNRDQVKGLFDSLYKRHPVGSLLLWTTESKKAAHRGDTPVSSGVIKLLLDGQQRITSVYGVARGKAPDFFEGDSRVFQDLRFNLDTGTFSFFQPMKMSNDPLWINVSELMKAGQIGHERLVEKLAEHPEIGTKAVKYSARISRILGILDIDLHAEEITGEDKSIDIIVDIFNRVNSGGTKLSKGDLALAKICSDWPDARKAMNVEIENWQKSDFNFNLDWLLRSINTVLTGEAKFQYLHNKTADEVQEAFHRAKKHIDTSLNYISGRLGLDHDRVLFGRFGIPVMVRYFDQRERFKMGPMSEVERDKLLFWYAQAGMWGRFSGSTESFIDKDLEALEPIEKGLDQLVEQLKLWHGGLRVEADHFSTWSVGSRFYPVLYMMTRMGEAKDWGNGLPLNANLLGKMNKLEVHHIFPKAQLYKRGHDRMMVNALANYCFLIKDTNLTISDRLPEEYFPEIEAAHPGALASQWIPMDRELWKIENYLQFLEARKQLLADALNKKMEELLHGDSRWLTSTSSFERMPVQIGGSISNEDEEQELKAINQWVVSQSLPKGLIPYTFTNEEDSNKQAIFDLAWPSGLQEELSQPVAVLLNEGPEVVAFASQSGFRVFTEVDAFKKYVRNEVLGEE
jgi:hypothetical protein